jgi:hypothetical protein
MTHHTPIVPLALASLLCVASLAACGGKQSTDTDESAASLAPRARNGNLPAASSASETADINLDGRPDQFVFREGGSIAWAMRDLDFDGEPDIYEYFDAAGSLVEQEFQLDFDPAIDAVRIYVHGRVVRKELATGYDGLFTLFKYYDPDGTLLRIERDDDADGTIDTWEYYDGGRLTRIGRDQDDDGTPEVIEDAN